MPGELSNLLNYSCDIAKHISHPLPHGRLRLECVFQTREHGGGKSIVESREDVLCEGWLWVFILYFFRWGEMGKGCFHVAS